MDGLVHAETDRSLRFIGDWPLAIDDGTNQNSRRLIFSFIHLLVTQNNWTEILQSMLPDKVYARYYAQDCNVCSDGEVNLPNDDGVPCGECNTHVLCATTVPKAIDAWCVMKIQIGIFNQPCARSARMRVARVV